MVDEILEVSEVIALLRPMFHVMLTTPELATLTVEIVSIDDVTGPALDGDDLVEQNSAVVRWRILHERGWSGGLWVEDGPDALVRNVQSDLQDFIAESEFGWGQLRGPRDLP
ncbi:hypothetical protein ASG04_04805 [Curtobacterium sp. Leaf183]|nr:hypothetical protein ASG04_04805 [Curtobacterium sp. Leaf183]